MGARQRISGKEMKRLNRWAVLNLNTIPIIIIHAQNLTDTDRGGGINDKSPNIKILKVPGDFPIKYGPKTLKKPYNIYTIDPCQSNITF